MRIESSAMTLASTNDYVEMNTKDESLKTWTGNQRPDFEGRNSQASPINILIPKDILDLSEEGRKALQNGKANLGFDFSKQAEAAAAAGRPEDDGSIVFQLSDADKQKLLMIQKMIEALTGKKIKFVVIDKIKLKNLPDVNLQIKNLQAGPGFNAIRLNNPTPVRQGWGLEFDSHEAHYERQTASFSAAGTVKTSDGREINLDMQLNMSREFASSQDISIRAGDAVRKDPLVINFDSAAAGLTQQKINFDIDNDGTSEQMSFLKQGSGFLALDLNNDGVVNNGSELFGPKSGDGFADLASYDADKNGWIDENDDIYDKLRIWTKDENGNDQLFALGQKGIGAIYLGNVKTDFDLKDGTNQEMGNIGSTGLFLREDGTAGTVQHIDLAV